MKWIILLLALFLSVHVIAQDIYYTKNGRIAFFSRAPLENIEAYNNEVVSFIDIGKNQIAFSVLIKSFKFEKALMEEHFNANYMESDSYPKATFMGKVVNVDDIRLDVDGKYQAKVEGVLTIHNVSRKISIDAIIGIKDKQITYGSSKFSVRLSDYNIKIPSIVSQNIAEVIEVTVDCKYIKLEDKK